MIKALLTTEDIKNFIQDVALNYEQNYILDRTDMKEYFNITEYQLDQYLDEGLPWCGSPTRKKFNIVECKRWFKLTKG